MTVKLVCMSDTHLQVPDDFQSPDGDVFIHAGDLTGRGSLPEIERALQWVASQPQKIKIITPGNHDFGFEHYEQTCREKCARLGIVLLINEAYEIGARPCDACGVDSPYCSKCEGKQSQNVRFWGSPWTPWFFDWAFNFRPIDAGGGYQARSTWAQIPTNTDVLITHGPPRGVLDRNRNGTLCGCEELRERLGQISPAVHIFGHIHEGYGSVGFEDNQQGTNMYNVSTCNSRYEPVNKPVVIDI